MPLLASPHKQALRELLSRDGIRTVPEIEHATGLTREQTLEVLGSLQRSGLVRTAPGTPGLGGARWVLTTHGREVGPTLAVEEASPGTKTTPTVDPAEGWGFPWRPSKPEEPMYATDLPRKAVKEQARTRRPPLAHVGLDDFNEDRKRPRFGLLFIASALTIIGAAAMVLSSRSVSIEVSGIQDGVSLHPDVLVGEQIRFGINGGNPDDAELLLDGFPVSGWQRFGDSLVWVVPPLTEGDHTVEVSIPRRLFGTATQAVSFEIDATPPDLGMPPVYEPVDMGAPILISGTAEDGVIVVIDGEAVEVTDGKFVVELPEAPAAPVAVLAIDRAGNTTAFDLKIPVLYPATRGVHVSAAAWGHDGLRTEIIRLINEGKISAVELDLKDEAGFIGYNSAIPLANEIGAVTPRFNLKEAIDELHAMDVRVIGRLVAFRDPALAVYAWDQGNTDWVIQTLGGTPLSKYGGFTNFANPEVQAYNLAIAAEAAEAGIDDILWDYMRRPEGDLGQMLIPGLGDGDPSAAIVKFLEDAHSFLRTERVFQGVSVFGIAARRGEYIAQDVSGMAPHVDYVAPMLYPSHWAKGEYGVAHPEAQPYDIIYASLRDFQEVLEGTNVALVPWLQDFTMHVDYGPEEVQAQIAAAAELGIDDFLLWDPTVTYTGEGLTSGVNVSEGPPPTPN